MAPKRAAEAGSTKAATTAKPRRQADDWVLAGLRVLATGAIADVKVERLATDLGVTKGSFYWHFDDRPALLRAMCARWVELDTDAVIRMVDEAEPDDPLAAVERLFALVADSPGELDGVEAGIREWSVADPEVAATCREVDERRLTYVTDHLMAAGLPADRARGRAEILYRIIIGEFVWRRYGGTPLEAEPLLEAVRRLSRP